MKQGEQVIQALRDWVRSREKKTNEDIEKEFLKKTGDASKVTNVFSNYGSRTLPASGESLDITLGKIRKWLSDLSKVAISGYYIDLEGAPVETVFFSEFNALDAAEEITLCHWEDYSSYYGHIDMSTSYYPMLIYGSGGAITAAKIGQTDFMRCYLVFPKKSDNSTGAGEGWGLVQLGSVGSTARWSLSSTLTTASSYEHSLGLKVPKGSWAHVTILSLPL